MACILNQNKQIQIPTTMKKIYYLALLLPLFLISCEDDNPPVAQFSIDMDEPEVGQAVTFYNDSKHSSSFEWDFGDGVISTDENPIHVFTGTGVFEVTLTAYNAGMEDVATMDLEIFIPTILAVYVYEWNEGLNYDNPISGASVWLFPDLLSWDNEENIYAEGFTDIDGVVAFSNLDEQSYFVDVWEENYNNYALRDEDPGWIETDVIVRHTINWFDAWVDFVGGKGEMNGRRGGSFVIKGLDRKFVDAQKPAITEDWKTLYDKSIKVK
jgi:hypothetical protein